MSVQAEAATPKRGRGRPPKTHDNRRVQAALIPWLTFGGGGCVDRPAVFTGMAWLDDILTGASQLQSEGQRSTRPLDRRLILRILLRCPIIDTASVSVVTGRDYERAQIDRYTAAARVASKGVAAQLERRPEWAAQMEANTACLYEFDGSMTEH